jgi:tRNA1Val (adenine37-N6)-methyltransferase
MSFLKDGERLEDLQRGGFKLIQDPRLFCFGLDAVLLSSFAKGKKGEKCVDLGTGSGVIPILMAAKTNFDQIYGIEIQPVFADMAQRSVKLNSLEDKVFILRLDLRDPAQLKEIFQKQDSFDAVTANPPYIKQGAGAHSESESLRISRHEICCSIEDAATAAARLLRPQGRFYLVHRPQRLPDAFQALREKGLEPKVLRFVHASADKAPTLFLLESIRNGKPHLCVEPPLLLREGDGESPELRRIYGNE